MAMQMRILDGIDPALADGALAAAVLSLGNTFADPVSERFRDLSQSILAEAQRELRSTLSSDDKEARRQVRSYLSKIAQERLLDQVDIREVENQLGNEGRLALGGYSITLSDAFKDGFKKESGKLAISCVRENDFYDHISTSDPSADDQQTSVFVKKIRSTRGNRLQWALAVAHREKTNIKIIEFYRLFPEVFTSTVVESAISVLAAFGRHYAVPVEVQGEVFPDGFYENIDVDLSRPFRVGFSNPSNKCATSFVTEGFPMAPKIRMLFSVNLDKYWSDWTKFA